MKFVGKAIELIQSLRNTRAAEAQLVEHPAPEKTEKSMLIAQPTESRHDSRSPLLTLTLSTITGPVNALQQSRELCDALHEVLSEMVSSDQKYTQVNLTAPRKIPEPNFPIANIVRNTSRVSYYRWRASTESQCLSVRASEGIVELFLIQADDIPLLSFSEFGSRLKGRFELTRTTDGYGWMLGKSPADFDEAVALIQRCLNDLLDEAKDADGARDDKTQPERHGAIDSLHQLMLEKENLIFKVLNQQEIIKNELARSLHDTVLADLLMLKRHMRGDQELSKDDILDTIDEIAQQLRDICNECAPRNLHDWGLKTSLQDMLQRMGQRNAIECSMICDLDIPNLPDTVELHIFRLVQECLNNIEKHAKASKVTIHIERSKPTSIRFNVTDNGKGFIAGDPELSADSGGMGVSGMRERAELIRCFFPTEFGIQSTPGQGTVASIEITLPSLGAG